MTGPSAVRARPSPSLFLAVIGAVAVPAVGVALSRPDVIAVALPLALWAVHAGTVMARNRDTASVPGAAAGGAPQNPTPLVIDRETDAAPGWAQDSIRVESDAEIVEVALVQAERRRRRVFVPGRARLRARSRVRHSGPLRSVEASARGLHADAALLDAPTPAVVVTHALAPIAQPLGRMPLAPRLTGLHGSHEGIRPGQGGDFRDIHPFAPGDELRRVDWKATARAARRPGELLIRRTNTLSDASAVIVMDTADDLGEVVSTWGTADLQRSGVTSLDLARAAARSIAEATVAQGDPIAFHTLAQGGRSVRSGGGRRQLARLVAEIAASGRAGDDSRFRRTPPVPHGSIIHVLSTFFDGAAAEIAVRWRASGHRVVAVDVLPALRREGLTDARELALEVLLAEREDMLHVLRESGVEVVRWQDEGLTAWTALTDPRGRIAAPGTRGAFRPFRAGMPR